jgi:peroxiredoxin
LRSFEQHIKEFHARGVEVVAISVDPPNESQKLCTARGYTFPFLSDPDAKVIRQYGVQHPKAGENGQDIARPAEFLVGPWGTITWAQLTDDIRVRARPEAVLRVIDALPKS